MKNRKEDMNTPLSNQGRTIRVRNEFNPFPAKRNNPDAPAKENHENEWQQEYRIIYNSYRLEGLLSG